MTGQARGKGRTPTGSSRSGAGMAPLARQLDQTLADLDRVLSGGEGEPGDWAGVSAQDAPFAASGPVVQEAADESRALVLIEEPEPPELDSETLALLTRFVAGALISGGDMLLERLRYWDGRAALEPTANALDVPLEQASSADLMRYWLLGSIAWGRRQAVGAVHRGAGASADLAGSAARTADRLTSNWLLRPLRQPLQNAIDGMVRSANDRIREGQQEDRIARWLATHTIEDITDLTIDYISENPQLAALVREQLAAQSVGITTAVVDTGRDWGEAADDVVEGVVRRLLGRRRHKGLVEKAILAEQRIGPEHKAGGAGGAGGEAAGGAGGGAGGDGTK